jgi:hypothetical protein
MTTGTPMEKKLKHLELHPAGHQPHGVEFVLAQGVGRSRSVAAMFALAAKESRGMCTSFSRTFRR